LLACNTDIGRLARALGLGAVAYQTFLNASVRRAPPAPVADPPRPVSRGGVAAIRTGTRGALRAATDGAGPAAPDAGVPDASVPDVPVPDACLPDAPAADRAAPRRPGPAHPSLQGPPDLRVPPAGQAPAAVTVIPVQAGTGGDASDSPAGPGRGFTLLTQALGGPGPRPRAAPPGRPAPPPTGTGDAFPLLHAALGRRD
jgi:hypothetical protein